jgi:diaminopimelate epimerase
MESGERAPFIKMSGSGNDFVFFDVRDRPDHPFAEPARIQRLCARGTGVGADGVVLIENSAASSFAMRYFNADGSLAALCGNATLCAARLAVELGVVSPRQAIEGFQFEVGVGTINARVIDGIPEIELTAPHSLIENLAPRVPLASGETLMGYLELGVPHVVIVCQDADAAPVMTRGKTLRSHEAFPHGANVNFVSRSPEGWRYRTYERGVENETLACGTGAAACAILLDRWRMAEPPLRMRTSSGSILEVELTADGARPPRLRGKATIVFDGSLREG